MSGPRMGSVAALALRLQAMVAERSGDCGQWRLLAEDAVAEATRLRRLVDRTVHTMNGGETVYCPADDESPFGDPVEM